MARRGLVDVRCTAVLLCVLLAHGGQGQPGGGGPDLLAVGPSPGLDQQHTTTTLHTAPPLDAAVHAPKPGQPPDLVLQVIPANMPGGSVAPDNLLTEPRGNAFPGQSVEPSIPASPPGNPGFLGSLPDTLVLSDAIHNSINNKLGFNDLFLQEPMIQQPVHRHLGLPADVMPPEAGVAGHTVPPPPPPPPLVHRAVQPPVHPLPVPPHLVPPPPVLPPKVLPPKAHPPVRPPYSATSSIFPRHYAPHNHRASFLKLWDGKAAPIGEAKRKKSAVLLSNRYPFFLGKTNVLFDDWINLKSYKTGFSKDRLYMGNQGAHIQLKSLLQAGSISMFENQFKYMDISHGAPGSTGSTSGYLPVFDSVLQDMDLNVDPCNDFYQFACGGFVANATRTNGMVNKLEGVKNKVVRIVGHVLELNVSSADPVALVKGKQFYASCMNEPIIEARGLTPLRNFLSDRGGWPVLGLWDPRRFDLVQLLAAARPLMRDHSTYSLPSGAIIGISVQKDYRLSGVHAVYLDQPSLGQLSVGGAPNQEVYQLGRDLVYTRAYEEYLVDVAVALGAAPALAARDMCDVVALERALADIMLPEKSRRLVEKRYRRVSLLEMSLRYPYLDWPRLLQQVLQTDGTAAAVRLSQNVVLWASPYYDRLGKVIAKTPKRVLANYVLFRAMQNMLPASTRLMQFIKLRYVAVANGADVPKLQHRSEFCSELVVDNMGWLASRIYVESSLGQAAADQVLAVQEGVKAAMADIIQKVAWLDRATKTAQLRKLRRMKDRLGFPLELLNDKLLDTYYSNFNITNDLFENMEMVLRQNYVKTLQKLRVPSDDDWIVRPSDVRVLYNSGDNAVEVPAAFVQRPFIDAKYSPAMSFGGLGTWIANAYAQAYDVSGMKFDGTGVIRRQWSDQALYQYRERANCFINQYSNYYLPDADLPVVNGNKTLSGNLADNMAVTAGYAAYRSWVRAHPGGDQVSELPFSGEQLFYINYARTHCQAATPTYTRRLPYSSPHSVPRLRVTGPLQNSHHFAAAFQCRPGSRMNPRDKCAFW